MIEGEVEVIEIAALPQERGERFAARTGFDPRALATPYPRGLGQRLSRAGAKEHRTYYSKLVRSSQATQTETAKAAPLKRWRQDEHGH
jgi:hypothetical protein